MVHCRSAGEAEQKMTDLNTQDSRSGHQVMNPITWDNI